MTQEQKARAYDEAKLRISAAYNSNRCTIGFMNEIFPELAESKDEKIRKRLLEYFKSFTSEVSFNGVSTNDALAWLEKQGEQKSFNIQQKDFASIDPQFYKQEQKFEPKFKVGYWVTNSIETVQITGYDIDYGYQVDYKGNLQHRDTDIIEKEYHLWTIQDAKDGDVLSYVTDEEDLWIMIYWSLYEPYEGHVHYHALLVNDNFTDKGTCCICIEDLKPATKEQRDLLFQKMKENGYEWDTEKKHLKQL